MNPDEILFAPIHNEPWRDLCRDIVNHIENHRKPHRNVMSVSRQRPADVLDLMGLLEAYHDRGQSEFWRIDYPDTLVPELFTFDGTVFMPRAGVWFPSYYSGNGSGHWELRSIEDTNLVPNTYTHKYIFANEPDALKGLMFLIKFYP